MIRLISFIVLFSSLNLQASELIAQDKASSTKVAAAAKTWEKIFTPNLCSPDAATFKVVDKKDLDVGHTFLKATKMLSTDVTALTTYKRLKSKTAINAAVKSVLSDMGMQNDPLLAAQLLRIAEKVESRLLYLITTTNEEVKFELTGTAFAVYDIENGEMTLLTTGDSFRPSSCE